MNSSLLKSEKEQAFQLFQQQRFAEAKLICARYCKANKKDLDAWNLLGAIYGQLNDLVGAKKCFDKMAKLQPTNPQVFFNLSLIQQKTNNMAGAEQNLLKAIRLKADFFEAHFNLADLFRAQGKLAESIDAFLKAAKLKTDYAPLYLNLGSVYRLLDMQDKAIECFLQAIKLEPNNDEAYVNLGMVYIDQTHFDEAEKVLLKAIEIKPSQARAFLQLGLLSFHLKLLDKAQAYLNTSIKFEPRSPVAFYNLGVVLTEQLQLDEAEAAFNKALALDAEYVNAYQGLASVQKAKGASDVALETLNKALVFKPDYASFYTELGSLTGFQGGVMASVLHHERAVELEPESFKANIGLAYSLYNTNNYDAAIVAFEKAASCTDARLEKLQAISHIAIILERRKKYGEAFALIEPYLDGDKNHYVALAFGNLAKKIKKQDLAIDYIEQALAECELVSDNKSELQFLLGKIYDGCDQFDKAFNAYSAANHSFCESNADQISRYTMEKEKEYMQSIKSFFTEAYFKDYTTSKCCSERPVFVVGMPRSGTTLTESIVASHPLAFGAGEMHDMAEIKKATEAQTGVAFPESMKNFSEKNLNKLAQHYLSRLELKNNEAIRMVDKMPHNFLLLGLIAQLFPQARIIHIQRYPIDNCLSIYFQRFNIAHTYATSLEQLGDYYPLYLDLMAHWNKVLPLPILNVKYDELVANQEFETRRMIEFCGLEWDEACLSFHSSKRDVGTPSYDQVNQPMYNKSSGRWRNYEKNIGALVDALHKNKVLNKNEI